MSNLLGHTNQSGMTRIKNFGDLKMSPEQLRAEIEKTFSEHELQVKCINWFRTVHPGLILFSIPNGGHRDIRVARKMKAEGQLAGVPDLFLAEPRGDYHGMFIEMKVGKNKLSALQQIMTIQLCRRNYSVAIVRNSDEFQNAVKKYLG